MMARKPAALRCFEAAARLENFSHAANELHLTHGAVSRAVRLLEDELGVALF
ncbi:LysR family transcriptional regulator, partial [Pseudomonas aeruginosa]|nr:LysR family transcriptional regulator [Pseudomonas aeruginosa]